MLSSRGVNWEFTTGQNKMLPRDEPQVRMVLYYCKDSSSVKLGIELLKELQSSFPQFQFVFRSAPERSGGGRPKEFNLEGVQTEVPLQVYVGDHWGYMPENDGRLVLWDSRQVFQLTVRFPPVEGVRLAQDYKGRPFFTPAYVEIAILQSEATQETMDSLYKYHNLLFVRLSASYSFICSSLQNVLPGPVSRRLRGVYWITAFGPDLIDLIGRSKFQGLPCYCVDELSDLSLSVRLTLSFDESLSKASRRNSAKIMYQLGLRYFLPPLLNRSFILPFRFLLSGF